MRRSRGQGSAETMLVISVLSIAIVASAATMVPLFRSGVENLGRDVSDILTSGSVGGSGAGGGSNGNGSGAGGVNAATANSRMGEATREASDDVANAADTIGNEGPDNDRQTGRVDNIGPVIQ